MSRFSQDLTAILLPYSGDLDLAPPDFLQSAHPKLILLSVDTYNRSGHPDPQLLAALEGYPLNRTDYHGSIELVTDGQQMWGYSERD